MLAGDDDLLTCEEYEMLTETKTTVNDITIADAIEDTIYLFRIYRSSYGGYTYFGEENFIQAEENILAYLNEYPSSTIPSATYADKVQNELYFIIDSHFTFNYQSSAYFNDALFYSYFGTDFIFRQDDIGYYTTIYDKKWYLDSVNGEDIADYIKVSIDTTGELVYRIVDVFNPDYHDIEGYTILKRGETSIDVNFEWSRLYALNEISQVSKYGNTLESIASLQIIDDVPVLTSRFFYYFDDEGEDLLNQYAASGSELKNQSTFIVDTRSNGGGQSYFPVSWTTNYVGQYIRYKFINIMRSTYANNDMESEIGDSDIAKFEGSFYTENTNNIIFLTDKGSGSSGESVVEQFMILSNTLIVGTNTVGCLIGGNAVEYYLPNSGICTNVGRNCLITSQDDGYTPEGVGFMPDVFVQSADALDLSLAMIEYYDLEKSQNLDSLTLFGWSNLE